MSSKLKFLIPLTFLSLLLAFRFFQIYTKPKPVTGEEIRFLGKVLQEPVILGQSQYFQVGHFRVRTKLLPKFHYGDYLQITGTPAANLLISFPKIEKLGEKKNLLSPILAFRRFLISTSNQLWPQPEASLLTGIILGQDAISADFRQALINTGTIHIVVVSGQNVSMLAGVITATFGRVAARRTVSILLIISVIFYTVLTGAQPPTIRAAIMGILAFLARISGRENLGFVALGITVFIMLFAQPELLFNISFQLSTAATFGILFAQPLIAAIFKNLPNFVKDSQSVTISAWIFTAPLIAFYFAQFTPVTPLSNLLVLPTVPFLMIAGAISLGFSSISLFLAKILAFFSFIPAFYFTFVTQNLAKIPFVSLKLPQFNIFIIAGCYVFLFTLILWLKKRFLANN